MMHEARIEYIIQHSKRKCGKTIRSLDTCEEVVHMHPRIVSNNEDRYKKYTFQ